MQFDQLKRRDFITLLADAAAACDARSRIPSPGLLESVAEAAGACLSGARARDPGAFGARGSRRLPGSVVGIGFGVCFRGNPGSLAGGPGARLAIIVSRPGAGRGLACLLPSSSSLDLVRVEAPRLPSSSLHVRLVGLWPGLA